MLESVSKATVINLEQVSGYPVPGSKGLMKDQIVHFLETMAEENLTCHADYLDMPSISSFSSFFNTTSMDVYDALRSMRMKGYDYQFSSLDGSVQLWRESPAPRRIV